MALTGQAVSEEKIFEIVDDGQTTDGRTDNDGRMPEHGYTISSPVSLRLDELKIVFLNNVYSILPYDVAVIQWIMTCNNYMAMIHSTSVRLRIMSASLMMM